MAATLTVYAYGNVDSLHGIFNAIAMVMATDDFHDMVTIAVIIGFLTVGVMAMAPAGISKSWNWFMSVAVLNALLLLPKTNVAIVDRLGMAPAVVVGNVPWTLGLIGSVKSSIGSTLTELFDSGFQTIPVAGKELPAELAYLQTGVLFGNRLVKISRQAGIADPNGNADMLNYMRSCVFPETEALAATMQKSTNLRAVINDPNPALIVAVHNAAGNLDTMGCDVAWALLNGRIEDWADDSIRSMAAQSFPERAITDAVTNTESALVAMYGKARLMAAATTAKEVMVQNILINATAEAAALHTASLDDPAMLTLASARAQAVAQMNAGYLTQGRIAEEALPLVRNVVEGILYAVFPIICLIALASEGKALQGTIKGYLMAMLWVELWPPMFAVVNYLQTQASAANMGAAGMMTGAQGLSLQTAAAVFGTSVSDLAVASWMVTFVPVIAAAVLFGMNQMVSSIGGAKPGSAPADAAAGQASKGNAAFGNLNMGQQAVSDYATDPFVQTRAGIGGMRSVNVMSGQTVDNYAESKNVVEMSDSAGWQQQLSAQSRESMALSTQNSQAWTRSMDTAFSQIKSLAQTGSKAVERGTALDVGKVASEEEMKMDIAGHTDRISKAFGISDKSGVSKAIEAATTGKAGLEIPFLGGIAATMKAGGQSAEAEELVRSVQSAGEDTRSKQTSRKQGVVDSYRHSEGFSNLRRTNKDAADRIDSSFKDGVGFQEKSAASLEHARSLELAERKVSSFGQQGVARWANEISAFFRANGEDPGKGVASTARQKGLLREFIMRGELAGQDGNWMPEMGQGPNVPHNALGFSRGGLENEFKEQPPIGGGYAGVQAARTRNDGVIKGQQGKAGVSPTMAVGGDDVRLGVELAQGRVTSNIVTAAETLSGDRGKAAADLAERGKNVSPQHDVPQVHGYSSNNPVVAGARHLVTPFEAERAKAEAARAVDAKNRRDAVNRIPK